MTRAKAKEVLDEAGYQDADAMLDPFEQERQIDVATAGILDRLDAAERNILLLTALLRAVSPARFGLSQTLEQMRKEAGIS